DPLKFLAYRQDLGAAGVPNDFAGRRVRRVAYRPAPNGGDYFADVARCRRVSFLDGRHVSPRQAAAYAAGPRRDAREPAANAWVCEARGWKSAPTTATRRTWRKRSP